MAWNNTLAKTNIIPGNGPGSAGLAIKKSSGRITLQRGAALAIETISSDGVGPVTAALTLAAKDDGRTVLANIAGTAVVVTLPLAAAGLKFTIATLIGPTSVGTTITPNAADKFQGNGFNAKTAGQTLINTFATQAVGDLIELVGTDSLIWLVKTKIGTWA